VSDCARHDKKDMRVPRIYFWHFGHHAVVRPPIVARRNPFMSRTFFPGAPAFMN